ncbi:hypothetical protein C9374_012337 [Naegleria lovaniensis]|uniref:Uncharacterized protein n=1 Tax=Naegleria lovaniensis TaxID=51637 RepID=A0AA88KDT8_NAELO|nr:uncharacterized protein C9374_012337 [Naegleria lovaniensis]KAG2373234.1 hypothetical protein C9374_012337 [Naegleria lovaniensis]
MKALLAFTKSPLKFPSSTLALHRCRSSKSCSNKLLINLFCVNDTCKGSSVNISQQQNHNSQSEHVASTTFRNYHNNLIYRNTMGEIDLSFMETETFIKANEQLTQMEKTFSELLKKKRKNQSLQYDEELERQNLVFGANNLLERAEEDNGGDTSLMSPTQLYITWKLSKLRSKLLMKDFFTVNENIPEDAIQEAAKMLEERPYLAKLLKEQLMDNNEFDKYDKHFDQNIQFPIYTGLAPIHSPENNWLKYYIHDKLSNSSVGPIVSKKRAVFTELAFAMHSGLASSLLLGASIVNKDLFIFAFYYVVHFFSRMNPEAYEHCKEVVKLWDKGLKEQFKDVTFKDWETDVELRLDSCMSVLKAYLIGFATEDDTSDEKIKKYAKLAQKQDPNNFYVFTLDIDDADPASFLRNVLKAEKIILEKGTLKTINHLRFFPVLFHKANAIWSAAAASPDQVQRGKVAKDALKLLQLSFNNLQVPMDPIEVQTMADCKLMMAEPEHALKLYKEFFEVQFMSSSFHITHAVEVVASLIMNGGEVESAIKSLDRYCRHFPEEYTVSLRLHLINALVEPPNASNLPFIHTDDPAIKAQLASVTTAAATPPKIYKGKTERDQLEWCRKELSKLMDKHSEWIQMDPSLENFYRDISNKLEFKLKQGTMTSQKPKVPSSLKASVSKSLLMPKSSSDKKKK